MLALPPLSSHPRARHGCRRTQTGIVAVEFALIFLLGILPLLLLTLTGVLMFAAQQSLTLAATEGARAALRYGTPAERSANACNAAQQSMQWLLNFSGDANPCTSGAIAVSPMAACPSTADAECVTVTTSFDYDAHPFVPGAQALYGWVMGHQMSDSATVQLSTQGP